MENIITLDMSYVRRSLQHFNNAMWADFMEELNGRIDNFLADIVFDIVEDIEERKEND